MTWTLDNGRKKRNDILSCASLIHGMFACISAIISAVLQLDISNYREAYVRE